MYQRKTPRELEANNIIFKFVEWKLRKHNIVLFGRSSCAVTRACHKILLGCRGVTDDNYEWVTYDKRGDATQIDEYLWILSGENNRGAPAVFVRGDYLGDFRRLLQLSKSGKLQRIIDNLASFKPSDSSNYHPDYPGVNLALEGDPNIMGSLMLNVLPDDEHAVSVKITPFDPSVQEKVDCHHFAPRGSVCSVGTNTTADTSLTGLASAKPVTSSQLMDPATSLITPLEASVTASLKTVLSLKLVHSKQRCLTTTIKTPEPGKTDSSQL